MNGQNGAVGFEKRTRDLLDASLAVTQENTRDLAGTNLRLAQAWTDIARKGAQQCAHPRPMGRTGFCRQPHPPGRVHT